MGDYFCFLLSYYPDDSTPPLKNTPPPCKSIPEGIFVIGFLPSLHHRGTLNTTHLSDARLKHIEPSIRWTPSVRNTRAPVWIPVPAWRRPLRPITARRSSLRPGPLHHLLLPHLERWSRRFFPGRPRLPVPVLVLPLLSWVKPRWRVPVSAKREKLWQQRRTPRPQGLRPVQRLQDWQPLRLPQAARRCCPLRATSSRTTTRKPSSWRPRKKGSSKLTESWSYLASKFRR